MRKREKEKIKNQESSLEQSEEELEIRKELGKELSSGKDTRMARYVLFLPFLVHFLREKVESDKTTSIL